MGQLDSLIKDFNRKNKEDIAFFGIPNIKVPKIPFTSPRANYMLYGGIPRNRIIEFFGEEGGGKTTTALDIVGNAQKLFLEEYEKEIEILKKMDKRNNQQQTRLDYLLKAGSKRVVYVDCENTLDVEWAIKLGVDVEDLVLLKPQAQSAEEIFEMILDMVKTGEVGLVVIDSLGVMVSQQALEKTMEEKTYAGISQSLTTFTNKVTPLLSKFGCTIIAINQMREDMTSQYIVYKTPGGKAFKHGCSVRMMFQKGTFFDDSGKDATRSIENPAGNKVNMKIVKTKCCKPNRTNGFYTLNYTNGIDYISDLIEVALKCSAIVQTGAWYQFSNAQTGEVVVDEYGDLIKLQGKPRVAEYLAENDWLLEEIKESVRLIIED